MDETVETSTRDPEGSMGPAAAAEFVGTLGLVFFGGGAAIATTIGLDATGFALASGLAVAVMVAITYRASGGHVNPAVTIGLLATGKLEPVRGVIYVMAQLLGAIVGAFLLRGLMPGIVYDATVGGVPAVAPTYEAAKALGIEAVLSFFWVLAYVATSRSQKGSALVGLWIGLLVTAGVFAFSAFSGAAMNPARWLGPAFAAGTWTDWWVWVVGPIAGGILGALVGRMLAPAAEPAEGS